VPTRLSRYAEGVMEATWLAAIMLVPVFFDIYSSRIFEPDKLTLLRTLALLTLAAWSVKLLEEGGFKWEHFSTEDGWVKFILKFPLAGPVLGLTLIYIISTLLSVTPYTSLWGSYQRLQGTYTTLSYIVIFAAIVVNMRRKTQVERLISVAILTSLPVSLYGVLQRYHADPIPWGADTSGRVAANLGNSIFVAAYLIMALPLTLMRVIESFEALLVERGPLWPNFARSTVYVFILALQAITIYFSGSRGPWLGMGASLIVVFLGVSLIWRKRWMTIAAVVIAFAGGVFLVTLNIPGGPLESLRDRPEFGRLGQLLDAESRTGKVRTLIWQGAAELVLPHAPLEYPDGRKDPFNFIRPLIGYGPESMYVAYNRFYQPELTLVEKRNASPDRSHNETWDSLVITGLLGLVAYLTLFGSLLYFGLKWLGLVPGNNERNLFFGLYLLCGLVSAVGFSVTLGIKYLGVALPFGMILGVILYLILISLFGRVQSTVSESNRLRAYIMLGLVAAVVAHFIEINFGIAIAATRTYFWVYAGLLILVGYILPKMQVFDVPQAVLASPTVQQTGNMSDKNRDRRKTASTARRRTSSRKTSFRSGGAGLQSWQQEGLIAGLMVALLLTTLGYLYISNTSRSPSVIGLLTASFTEPAKAESQNGVLPLILTTWVAGLLLLCSESLLKTPSLDDISPRGWLKIIGVGAIVSFVFAFIYWLWAARNLMALSSQEAKTLDDVLRQVRGSEGLLGAYYFQVFSILFLSALVLPLTWPALMSRFQALSFGLATAIMAIAFSFAAYSNLRVIQADIAFKTGDMFANAQNWPVAISIYDRANKLAPNEDYYYLFLGRAYLEYAKTLSDPADRDRLIESAAQDLHKAEEINPLNTDHTANLARLYSLWATFSQDPARKQKRAEISNDYFAGALSLSPKNARLWDEWAVLFLNILNDPEKAKELLDKAATVDPYYDWTYALLGDYNSQTLAERFADQPEKLTEALQAAVQDYQKALELGVDSATAQSLFNYSISLGGVWAQLGQFGSAITAYEKALQLLPSTPDAWRVMVALSQLYYRIGDAQNALVNAQNALALAPEDQKQAVQDLITQLGG